MYIHNKNSFCCQSFNTVWKRKENPPAFSHGFGKRQFNNKIWHVWMCRVSIAITSMIIYN